ncbi:hypothetical protein ABBQ32_000165 [Trebouxia sp. C0010 RCD-2024]
MRRAAAAALTRQAAVEPVQSYCALLARIALSSQATTSATPEILEASYRDETGRHTCKRLRKDGRTPAIIFSMPHNENKLISISANDATNMVRIHGRMGLAAQRFVVNLGDEQLPVLPRVVHINAVSNLVENITFMHCPPERRITVPVPVQVRMPCCGFTLAVSFQSFVVTHCSQCDTVRCAQL